MLVPISTTFLTGVFLALYTSVVSASPVNAAVTPNNTGQLLRRAVPEDQHCGNMEWMWRECWPRGGEMAYRDICYSETHRQNIPVRANCKDDEECFDILDWHLDKTIMCVPVPKTGAHDTTTISGAQVGSSGMKVGVITPSQTMIHQVVVGDYMRGSVSAVLLSEKDDFVLTPATPFVGKVHGKPDDMTVCKGIPNDAIKGYECYPTGLYSLSKGDLINFSWGMRNAQKGSLKYVLSPISS